MRREVIRKYVEKYSLGLIDVQNTLDDYEKFFRNMGFKYTIKELVHEKISAQGKAVVMDLGCGNGGFLKGLKEIFRDRVETIGVDLMVAQNKSDRVVVGDALDAVFPQNIDLVFSFRSMHEMGHPDKIIEKVYSSLAPGGKAFLSIRTMDMYVGSVGIAEISESDVKKLVQIVRKGKLGDFKVNGFEVSLNDNAGKKFIAGVNIFLEK